MKRGFTLIELVIVLGVITIVTAGIMMTMRTNSNRALYNALRVIQADLQYIQRRSIIEGRYYEIFFLRFNDQYVLRPRGGGTARIRTVYLPRGISFQDIRTAHHNNIVSYTPRGTPSGGFTIVLENGRYEQELTGRVGAGGLTISSRSRIQSR